jgi:hypothetical protein
MSMTEALEIMSCRSRSSSPKVHAFALFDFFVLVSPGPRTSKSLERTGPIALVRGIVWLGAFTAFIAFHPGAELIECHGAEHRDPLAEHTERHLDGALAALATDQG